MKPIYKILAGTALGALIGYAYYYFIGCNNGTCPLTSTWFVSTAYGAVMGLIAFLPGRKSKNKK